MTINEIQQLLIERLKLPLPGTKAHKKLVPDEQIRRVNKTPDESAKKSAVLILLYPKNDEIYIPFIQKTAYEGVHSGQISLPGGKFENGDTSLAQTALREAEEEIGIDAKKVEIAGKISDLFIPVSNFLVAPYIGVINHIPQFSASPAEVDAIYSVNIKEIINPQIQMQTIKVRDQQFKTPFFVFSEVSVWGATAMILNELHTVLKDVWPA